MPMLNVLVPVLGLALLDSINPSALAVTLVLLTRPNPTRRVLVYMSAVYLAYFIIGAALMLGLGRALPALQPVLYSPAAYAVGGVLGLLMLLYASRPGRKSRPVQGPRLPESAALGATFVLGLTVSVLEFSTALPYLGAIGLITNAGLNAAQWLPILVAYNAILVAPPLALLALFHLFGPRLQARLSAWRDRLSRGMGEAWLTVIWVIGFFLLVDALVYFDFFDFLGVNVRSWFGRKS